MLRKTLFCSSIAILSLSSCGPSSRDMPGDDDGSGNNGNGNNGSNGINAPCNSGAYDFPGDGIDNDCDGTVDNPPGPCDMALNAASTDGSDFAKAIDICQVSDGMSWGLVSAAYSQTDGNGTPAATQHYLGPNFGTGVLPKTGSSLAILGTGPLRSSSGQNGWADFPGEHSDNQTAAFPSDWLMANGGQLPTSSACGSGIFSGGTTPTDANSPMMVTLKIKVPTNAASFTMNVNFFSSEFPEYVCSEFNDFFVVLLDSTYNGTPANPSDKNLAFYTPDMGATKYPVGVNLAAANKGLFSQCTNGSVGCDALQSININTCTGTDELAGNGMSSDPADCDGTEGGGTGWLQTSGNVVPGETITLRIATWNTSDNKLQSLAVIDSFQWNPGASMPGTTIFLDRPAMPGGPQLQTSDVESEETSAR